MSLSRLSEANDLYRYQIHQRYKTSSETVNLAHLAWRLEYKSRRYHEMWKKRRTKHGHKGAWEDCHTIACEEDRQVLEYIAR